MDIFSKKNGEKTVRLISDFVKRNSLEASIFGVAFVILFASMKFATAPMSLGNVEQWVNLTNSMFYGKQDMLFSYGPLYWLTGAAASLYSAIAYWTSITISSAVSAFVWTIIIVLTHKSKSYLLLAIAYFLFADGPILPAAWFLWPLALLAYLEFVDPTPKVLGTRALFFLGFFFGITFYIRFFYGMTAIITFGSYYLSKFIFDRKPLPLLIIVASTVLGYVFSGILIFHKISSVFNYLSINSQLNFGNSIDMVLDVQESVIPYLCVGVIVILLNVFIMFRRRSLFLALNVVLLILFKIGFSRSDHYTVYLVLPLAMISLLLVVDSSKFGKIILAIIISLLYYGSLSPVFPFAPIKNSLSPATDFSKSYAERMKKTYAEYRLSDDLISKIGHSTVDVYPYQNEYIFANELNYLHRPLFQSYMTLTPKLDSLNQKFLESRERPKFILWTAGVECDNPNCDVFSAIDGKYGLSEDPLTSSAILLNYHLVDVFHGRSNIPIGLFEENEKSTPYSENVLSTKRIKFQQWYEVPHLASGVMKLKIDFDFTALGRLKNVLFRGAVVKVKLRLVSGQIEERRINVLNASSGIWISPLPSNFFLDGAAVKAVMLESQAEHYFSPDFIGTWVQVPIKSVSVAPPLVLEKLGDMLNSHHTLSIRCSGSLDKVNVEASVITKGKAALDVGGWLASSVLEGTVPDQTLVTLTDAVGHIQLFPTVSESRPDVASAFNSPSLASSGFRAKIDVGDLSGKYAVGLALISGQSFYRCRQLSAPITLLP